MSLALVRGSLNKSSETKHLSDTKTHCKEMKWLNRYRRNLCYRFPEMIPVIERGLKQALEECRRQFSLYRWNCSPLNWKQVLTEGGILRKRKSS